MEAWDYGDGEEMGITLILYAKVSIEAIIFEINWSI